MGILDAAVFRAYGFTPSERDLVRDGLSIRLDEHRSGSESPAYGPPKADDFAAYSRIIASHLNAIDSIQWSAELIERSAGFAVVVCKATGTGVRNRPHRSLLTG